MEPTAASIQAKINILESEIKLKEEEIKQLREQKFDLEYMLISWDDMTEWLRRNGFGKDYERNPRILYLGSKSENHYTYCQLIGDDMWIGGYEHNMQIQRGKDMYVARDFRRYR